MPTVEVPSRNSAIVSLTLAAEAALDRHRDHGADRPGDEGEAQKITKAYSVPSQPVLEREEHRREHQHRGDAVDEEVEVLGGAADDHAHGDLAGGDMRMVGVMLPGVAPWAPAEGEMGGSQAGRVACIEVMGTC